MLTPDELGASRHAPFARPEEIVSLAPPAYKVAQIEISSPTRDEDVAAHQFGSWLHSLGFERPFVVASPHGRRLVQAIEGVVAKIRPPAGANEPWVNDLSLVVAREQADVVVAIGGGRCLDVAKLAGARLELPLIVVPTQLSHDGICSPVSVVPDERGVTHSLNATAPHAAYFSIATIARSPLRSLRAGVGDLISNPFALRDWELAATTGNDVIHEEAWHLSIESFGLIEPTLDRLDEQRLRSPHFLGMLSHALANSGVAMMLAGSSRPASGAEHKLSHAMDLELGGRALHGEQVAFACVISAALHGLAVAPLIRTLKGLGLPHHPAHLRLSSGELARVISKAPATRPGRYTVLEKSDLDDRSARSLIRELWGPE